MFYRVTAKLKEETAAELHRKLSDGTIQSQKPDGGEITAGLENAVVLDSGEVAWNMVCYCSTPLAHERATVFDLHFSDLSTEQVEGREQYEGRSFMERLTELSKPEGDAP